MFSNLIMIILNSLHAEYDPAAVVVPSVCQYLKEDFSHAHSPPLNCSVLSNALRVLLKCTLQ